MYNFVTGLLSIAFGVNAIWSVWDKHWIMAILSGLFAVFLYNKLEREYFRD